MYFPINSGATHPLSPTGCVCVSGRAASSFWRDGPKYDAVKVKKCNIYAHSGWDGAPCRTSEGLKTWRGSVLFVDRRQSPLQLQSSLEISQNLQPWKRKVLLEFIHDF